MILKFNYFIREMIFLNTNIAKYLENEISDNDIFMENFTIFNLREKLKNKF